MLWTVPEEICLLIYHNFQINKYVKNCLQNQQRLKLLLAAFEKHNRLMAEAVDGNGMDLVVNAIL